MDLKFKNILLSTRDLKKSLEFYTKIFGEEIEKDLDGSIILKSGIVLQENFHKLLSKQKKEIKYRSYDHELYYEVDDFENFINKLSDFNEVIYVNKPLLTPWNQKIVRIFDPDYHIIEIGESMRSIAIRLSHDKKTPEEIAFLIHFPLETIKEWLNEE